MFYKKTKFRFSNDKKICIQKMCSFLEKFMNLKKMFMKTKKNHEYEKLFVNTINICEFEKKSRI